MSSDQRDVISAEPRPVLARRAWVIAAVLAAALAAALITVVQYHGRSASHVTACGHGLVPGYTNHRSYPPGIPTLPPPGARILSCFASAAQAADHGFTVATPPGTLIVRGVFLLPTGPLTVRQCRGAARAAGFAVPCPTVAPALASTPLQLPNCDDDGGCSLRGFGFTFTEQGFAVPPDYPALPVAGGSFVLLAWRKAGMTDGCPAEPAIRRVRIGGDDAAFIACPSDSGELGGDVALGWVHQGVHVAVGFQGVNPTNIALDLAVARHLIWIAASPSS
jgi:hypothetical protein